MIYGTQEFAEKLKGIIKDETRHPLYEESVKHAEAMSVHIYGDKPLYLLERARPREDSEVQTYRVENYEPTTKAGADKAIDIVGKIFNPTLYSINFKDKNEQSQQLEKYTLEYFPNYNSLTNYNKDVTLRKMLADPNAVMAVKPEHVPESDSERPEPVVVIYGSPNVWYYDRDCFLLFIRKEESDRQTHFYFEYYDKNQYIEFYAWYDEPEKLVHVVPVQNPYVHNFKSIPAWFLRGKSKSLDNGSVLFESFFSSALPHWNLAVIHESDLLGAFINHMHPMRYEVVDECNYQFPYEGLSYPCRMGTITYPGGKGGAQSQMSCPHCNGSGFSSVKSSYGIYQVSKSKLDETNLPSGLKPFDFINVPTEATKLLKEHCKDMNEAAMCAINMDVEDKVGENQSGVAKVIDRSAQWDTLYTIGSVVFDIHLTNQYFYINKYMFKIESESLGKKEDTNLPEINKPTNFDILTTAELINNFQVAAKGGMDKGYLRVKSIEIANRDFATSPDVRRYLVTTINLDPLYGFTQDEINLGVNSGVIRKVDWAVHENLKTFMDRAIKEKKNFLELEKEQQLEVLESYGEELVKEAKPKVDATVLEIDKSVQDAA